MEIVVVAELPKKPKVLTQEQLDARRARMRARYQEGIVDPAFRENIRQKGLDTYYRRRDKRIAAALEAGQELPRAGRPRTYPIPV
jgi:hypothetical protein